MTLKKFIENLNEFVKENPETLDMNVFASKDDEGNGFTPVCFTPSKGFYTNNMNNTNINGKHTSAFACVGYDALGGGYHQNGLSKLEYFTAMAMQGILSNSSGWTDTDVATEWVSNAAIKFATKTLEKLETIDR